MYLDKFISRLTKKGLDKCIHKYIIIFVDTKGGDDVSPKGRPTDDPKILSTRIRLSNDDIRMLEYCAEVTGKKKSEIIRMGIREVYERLKK